MSNEIIKAEGSPVGADLVHLMGGSSSPAMQIMLDDRLFERAKLLAKYMAAAEGFTPRHLIGKTEACFAVVTRSLTWKLDPFAVACCTYQTPGGNIGYEGKLCQAILENSGKIEGPVRFEHYGDWSRVRGKFQIKKSERGKDYAVPTWGDKEAEGLGVTVRAKVVGEIEERTWDFDLAQAFPRNSTLWATDPKTQICYAAVRRFGNVAAPGIFMGVPFDREDWSDHYGPDRAKDVTPRPTREDYLDEEHQNRSQIVGAAVADMRRKAEAAERQAAADEARMDAEFQGATTGQMPDTAEERGEAPQDAHDEREAEQVAEPEAEVVDPEPSSHDLDPDYVKNVRGSLRSCKSVENIKSYWAAQPRAHEHEGLVSSYKVALAALEAKERETGKPETLV